MLPVLHRYEYGMAPEPIAKNARVPIVFPYFLQELRHGIMMDGKEEIGSQSIGACYPFDETRPGGSEGIEHERPTKSGPKERLFDLLGEKKVELILRDAARAARPRGIKSVPYVDDNTKSFPVATCAVGMVGHCGHCFAPFGREALHQSER
jgi:hypothetical protein